MIPPSRRREMETSLVEKGIKYSVAIEDVQKVIDEERRSMIAGNNKKYRRTRRDGDLLWYFSQYRSLSEIFHFMDLLRSQYSELVTIENIGKTFQNRNLRLLKIGRRSGRNKPIIWIDAGMHAREWIAIPSALFIAYQLVSKSRTEDISNLLNHYDWYILPVMNPDGYQHTTSGQRMWRKNRRPIPNTFVFGVDLNRNFGYMWNHTGTMAKQLDPCSDAYQGPAPFSEAETIAVSNVLKEVKGRMKLFLSLHSFGKFWVTPYSFTTDLPPDFSEMNRLARFAIQAMSSYKNTTFEVIQACRVYDGVLFSGASCDWTYGELGVIHSYTLEIGDKSLGYFTPKQDILHIGEEIWRAVKAAALYLMR